jgi:hypothetical protein
LDVGLTVGTDEGIEVLGLKVGLAVVGLAVVGFDDVGTDEGIEVLGLKVGLAVVGLAVVGFDDVVVKVRLPSTLTSNRLALEIDVQEEEEYMPNLSIDIPVVGAFTICQPLR